MTLPITFTQVQNDQTYQSRGSFEYFGIEQFAYVSDVQSIFVHKDTVWTKNHGAEQVIIDQLLENEFTIFTLLAGQFTRVAFDNPILEKGIYSTHFTIDDIHLSGELQLYPNGNPKEIYIQPTSDSSIKVSIGTISHSHSKSFQVEYPPSWEVIDLRE